MPYFKIEFKDYKARTIKWDKEIKYNCYKIGIKVGGGVLNYIQWPANYLWACDILELRSEWQEAITSLRAYKDQMKGLNGRKSLMWEREKGGVAGA